MSAQAPETSTPRATTTRVGSISTEEIKTRIAAMFADDPADLPLTPPTPAIHGKGPRLVNTHVALLVVVLAAGIGGAAAPHATLGRRAGYRRGHGHGAPFPVDG